METVTAVLPTTTPETKLEIPVYHSEKSQRVAVVVGKYSGQGLNLTQIHQALKTNDGITDVSYEVVGRVVRSCKDFEYVNGQKTSHKPNIPDSVYKKYNGEGYTRAQIAADLEAKGYSVTDESNVNRRIRKLKIEVVPVPPGFGRAFTQENLLELTKQEDFSVETAAQKFGVHPKTVQKRLHELHDEGKYYYPRKPSTGPNTKVSDEDVLLEHEKGLNSNAISNALDGKMTPAGVAYRLRSLKVEPHIGRRRGEYSGPSYKHFTPHKKEIKGPLTVDDLTKAIKNGISNTGMKKEEARAMANHVLNFFGYAERIIDNVLEPEDRDAFYMLEDLGILTTEREDTTLYDGRGWRIHYWRFRKDEIAELLRAKEQKAEPSLYDDVPEDVWSKTKPEKTPKQ